MPRRSAIRAAIPACLFLATGCTSPADQAARNSPEFKAGYVDGCSSASLEGANKSDTARSRDDAAYRSNAAYHGGWTAGFSACHAMVAPVSPVGDPLAMPRGP